MKPQVILRKVSESHTKSKTAVPGLVRKAIKQAAIAFIIILNALVASTHAQLLPLAPTGQLFAMPSGFWGSLHRYCVSDQNDISLKQSWDPLFGEGLAFDPQGNLFVPSAGLKIYDPNINLIGQAEITDPIGNRSFEIVIRSPNQVIVGNPVRSPHARLFIFDTSDLTHPVHINTVNIPFTDDFGGSESRGLAFDADGNLWVAAYSQLIKLGLDANGNPVTASRVFSAVGNPMGLAFQPSTGLLIYGAGNALVFVDPANAGVPIAVVEHVGDNEVYQALLMAFNSQGDLFVGCSDLFGGTTDIAIFRAESLVNLSGTMEASVLTPVRVSRPELHDFATFIAFQPQINRSPVAQAGSDQMVVGNASDESAVSLDGTASSDPDGDTLSYIWTGAFGTIAGPTPTIVLPLGLHEITLTVDDNKCETSSDTIVIHVVPANTAPVAKCKNVTVSAGVGCTAAASIDDGSSDPDTGDTITLTQIPAGPYPLGNTTVTLRVTDSRGVFSECTAMVTVLNPNPVVTLTGPASGALYEINTPVNFTATFTDAGGGTHSGTWLFDSISQAATIVEPSGATPGSANANYTFTAAGVYTVKLTVVDSCGGSGTADQIGGIDLLVVVYDPSAGFVTGGGWIDSLAGAYVPEPTLTGKANFGFVSKYQKGANVPTGNTEFQFKTGNLNFSSTVYQWLVVAGAKAQYKGEGTINGAGNYGFLLTATDGQINGGGGIDQFRIKIWDRNTGGKVYDNALNAPDDADPQAISGGNIVIHKPN